MDEIAQDVTAESSTATTDTPAPSAETLNPGTNGQPSVEQQPFHQHPRWQQMLRERNEAREGMTQLQKELADLRQWRQAQEQARGMTPEQQQYLQAGDALEKILQQHPRLKALMEMAQSGQQTQQTVQQLQQHQTQAHIRTARAEIHNLAKEAGYTSDRAKKHLEAILTQEIADMGPDAVTRYRSGDFSVFKEAFDNAKADGLISATRQAATSTTLQSKLQTRNLPPRPVGGQPGKPAPEQHEPGSKAWSAQLREKAKAVLGSA